HRMVLSPADARVLPFRLNTTQLTGLVCPANVARFLPVATSHRRTVWSLPEEARRLPSRLKAADSTGPVCPSERRVLWPLAMAHSLSSGVNSLPVASWLPPPAASVLPSGLKASALIMQRLWSVTVTVARFLPVATFHTLTVGGMA